MCPIDDELFGVEAGADRLEFDAINALIFYADAGIDTRYDLVEHAIRVVSIYDAFAGNRNPDEVGQMIWVHDVFDRFYNIASSKHTPDRAEAAKQALWQMFSEKQFSEKQIDYCLGVLYSMVQTEISSAEHRKHLHGSVQGLEPDYVSDKYEGVLEPEQWKHIKAFVDIIEITDFSEANNNGGFVAKACELLDNLRNPSSLRESALLQDVLEAEAFYAPILEVLGYDALASALRSQAHIIRFEKQGDPGDYIERARNRLDKIKHLGIDKITKSVFGEWSTSYCENAVGVDRELGEVPIWAGDCLAQLNDGSPILDIKYRIKAEGSLADKYTRYNGEEPNDIVGYTVISSNEEELAKNYSDFIAQNMTNKTVVVTPNKTKAYYVYGTFEFVETVKLGLKARGYEHPEEFCQFEPDADKDREEKGYRRLEVAKVTMLTEDDVPVEVQFVTQAERERSRMGEVAHIIYKYLRQFGDSITPEQARAFVRDAAKMLSQKIHRRRENVGPDNLDINRRTIESVRKISKMLDLTSAK